MSGFGRGGRGAALLKALEQPVRKPGEPPPQGPSPSSSSTSHDVSEQAGQKSFSRGRGVGRQSPVGISQATSVAHQSIPVSESKPIGRGMLMKLMQQRQQPDRQQPDYQRSGRQPQQPLQSDSSSLTSPPTSSMHRLSVKEVQPPAIPSSLETSHHSISTGSQKKGSGGQSIPITSNYLLLKSSTEGVYQYQVHYSPQMESLKTRYAMLNEHRDLIGRTRAFDGSILYLPNKITDSSITRVCTRASDGTQVTLTITLTNIVSHVECIHLFNVIIRRVLKAIHLKQVGRHYYDNRHPIQIPQHKMELWPGYVTAVQQYDGGLLLMLDVSHRLIRTDTALDFLYELYSNHKQDFQEQATKQLVGNIVLTRYNNKTYRVDDIAWDKNPQSTFLDHSGKAITFIDYYKSAYSKTIEDVEQPLLLHRPKRRNVPPGDSKGKDADFVICLVPELCCMTGLTDAARSDFKVMKDVAVHTRVSPNQRQTLFKKFTDLVNSIPEAKEEFASWGLSLHPAMIETMGRKAKLEKILFKDTTVMSSYEADWSRDVVKHNLISGVPLHNWLLVFTRRDQGKAGDFLQMMKRVCPPMGIEIRDAVMLELPNDRTDTYIRSIRDHIKPDLQLVVIIFPTSRDDRYSSVKKLCCIEQPVPSQVINARTISMPNKLRSVTQKVALQINAKLGGELWAVEIPLKNLMVIGIDVYHDSVKSTRGRRSILGFVSSTNRHLTRWYSRVIVQDTRQEIVDSLKLCMKASLAKYHEVNKSLPDRIIVFRDGVGDGQMGTINEFEVPQLKSCFSLFGDGYDPKLAIVIVQKRISTRIFMKGPNGLDNAPSGTIVDHTITRKDWYDFFLVSQHVRQGTVTPTHYNVVYDTSALSPDHMQRLTYKMTHMYYNWPGTIRVPAPCQYAHKVAFLVGQSLHKAPSLDLADRLFYL